MRGSKNGLAMEMQMSESMPGSVKRMTAREEAREEAREVREARRPCRPTSRPPFNPRYIQSQHMLLRRYNQFTSRATTRQYLEHIHSRYLRLNSRFPIVNYLRYLKHIA